MASSRPQILLVGLNHRTAPLEVREGVSFSKEQLPRALPALRDRVGEVVILSTCNRTEVYSTCNDPAATRSRVLDFVADFHGLPVDSLAPYLYVHAGADAARHLFRVASGLDSMILGESQILGQVRDSLSAASHAQSAQVALVGLFHAGVRAGRRVREETEVGRNALSVSYAGVQLAQRVLGNLGGRRVLLIGAGEAGQLVAKALRTAGVKDLVIANRTTERAEELAGDLGGRVVPFSDLGSAMGEADIVIAATDSPDVIVSREMVASALTERGGRTQFFFDLAMPRDVDPGAQELDGVSLFNIDDLSSIAEENLRGREQAAAEAEAIVDEELTKFMSWWRSLDAAPLIKSLQSQAEEIRRRELERALRKLPTLSPEEIKVVEALSRSIARKLLHEPTKVLRQQAGESQLRAARDLFSLWEEQ